MMTFSKDISKEKTFELAEKVRLGELHANSTKNYEKFYKKVIDLDD
jgi:hypothetical protein